jgi:hypothetical protein
MATDDIARVVRLAIDLVLVPSRIRMLKSEPLPEGVSFLLRIAAGDRNAAREAGELSGKSPEVVQAAAGFFIQQILFAPQADSYRVLGAQRDATAADLRRNLALLARWLHTDAGGKAQLSIFVPRVMEAWNNLKTPERRAAYDRRGTANESREQIRRDCRSGDSSANPASNRKMRSSRRAATSAREVSLFNGIQMRERIGLLRHVFYFVFRKNRR